MVWTNRRLSGSSLSTWRIFRTAVLMALSVSRKAFLPQSFSMISSHGTTWPRRSTSRNKTSIGILSSFCARPERLKLVGAKVELKLLESDEVCGHGRALPTRLIFHVTSFSTADKSRQINLLAVHKNTGEYTTLQNASIACPLKTEASCAPVQGRPEHLGTVP